jgi:predicted aspartyl protease
MRSRVGTFRFPVELGDATGSRFMDLRPLVDTGALYSQFPESLLASLGHKPDAVRQFRLADGSLVERPIGEVPIRILGEKRTTVCIFGSEDSEHLLGAFTLEAFSLAPDPVNGTLVPVVAMLASFTG